MPSAPSPLDTPAAADPWRDVVGQAAAVRQLVAAAREPVHAYLLVGPAGSGKRSLARAFAGALLASDAADDAARERHVRLALAGHHPDLRMVEPEGNTFRKGDAERVVRNATLAPVEGGRKVVVADGCQDMEDEAAGYLLKTVEEPPASTVFVLLTTEMVPELVTIASRCVRVELKALPEPVVAERLVAEGVDPERAASAAAAAAGDLERARTLATDDRLALRHQAWRDVPHRVDSTGHTAATVVTELQSMIGEALAPLQERQAAEVAALDEQIEQYGLRGSGKKDLETRHKREVRRFRTAELRFGLATLAAAYRDALVAHGTRRDVVDALARIDAAAVSLQVYPNETLLLQALVANLPSVPPPAAEGQALFDQASAGEGVCLGDGLKLGAGKSVADLTTENPLTSPDWLARLAEQELGSTAPAVPAYVYHGSEDQVIPPAQTAALTDAWCAGGADVVYTTYPVDHLAGVTEGTADGAAFLEARFAGEELPPTCA